MFNTKSSSRFETQLSKLFSLVYEAMVTFKTGNFDFLLLNRAYKLSCK